MFDTFNRLKTVEQKLKYLDATFTPIVTEALTEFKNKYNLPGKVFKDIYFDKESRYEANFELAKGHGCIIRVMLYTDFSDNLQSYYSIHLYLYYSEDKLSQGLAKEDILTTLEELKSVSDKKAREDRESLG